MALVKRVFSIESPFTTYSEKPQKRSLEFIHLFSKLSVLFSRACMVWFFFLCNINISRTSFYMNKSVPLHSVSIGLVHPCKTTCTDCLVCLFVMFADILIIKVCI